MWRFKRVQRTIRPRLPRVARPSSKEFPYPWPASPGRLARSGMRVEGSGHAGGRADRCGAGGSAVERAGVRIQSPVMLQKTEGSVRAERKESCPALTVHALVGDREETYGGGRGKGARGDG